MSIEFDFTEVDALAADLGEVPARAKVNVRKAVEVTSRGIKDDWRNVSKGLSGRHAKGFPSTINYDIEVVSDGVIGEIGPDLGRKQGSLGFLEEGVGSQNTSGQNAMPLAVKANENDFLQGLLMAITEPLEK